MKLAFVKDNPRLVWSCCSCSWGRIPRSSADR